VRRLEGREEFDDVYLREEGDHGEVRFTMKYRPALSGAVPAPVSASQAVSTRAPSAGPVLP
jgi:hypothetical protein